MQGKASSTIQSIRNASPLNRKEFTRKGKITFLLASLFLLVPLVARYIIGAYCVRSVLCLLWQSTFRALQKYDTCF